MKDKSGVANTPLMDNCHANLKISLQAFGIMTMWHDWEIHTDP